MLIGNKVILRAVEKEDLETLRQWRNQAEFKKHFREYREINQEMQQNWFEKFVVGNKDTIMFSIIDAETKTLLGCCGLCYINWVQRNADLSLYIGYNNSYIDDVGYAKESCELLFHYGFNEIGLHKIWTEIYEFDILKFNLYLKIGLKQDALLRDHYYYDGKWINSRIMSILASEFN